MLHIWITWLIFLPLQQTFATKSIQRNTNFRFAHFIDHFFHVLDVPELDSTLVTDRNVCLRRCLKDQRCFSTNLAANPDINGNYVCELLPTDKYNASNSFGLSQYFHHYSLKTPCLLDPCQRNGTCQALYEQDDYWCECLRAYVGKQCESERPVCMKAKGDSPGVFYTTKAGLITAFKLVHISGEVGCVWNGRSKWGCTDPYKIATLITDDQNNIVFPENGRYSYTIPGFGSNSPELMLNFSTPLVVTADQEFRVWYSEDLGGTDIDNYPGPTCMKVIIYFA
ncbi:hypothetical protein ACROYT_G004159 [Oculina patagonica]